jgi:cobalamin biosynthesis protein CobD/CbiB
MKFMLAVLVFVLFAFFISWGILELLKGRPWLLLAAGGVFLGTFIKFGCRSH